MRSDSLQPSDIITCVNRAQQTMRDASRVDTREAAEKNFNVCKQWLRNRGIKHHQTKDGVWVLG
jgi:hypothetical protein